MSLVLIVHNILPEQKRVVFFFPAPPWWLKKGPSVLDEENCVRCETRSSVRCTLTRLDCLVLGLEGLSLGFLPVVLLRVPRSMLVLVCSAGRGPKVLFREPLPPSG